MFLIKIVKDFATLSEHKDLLKELAALGLINGGK